MKLSYVAVVALALSLAASLAVQGQDKAPAGGRIAVRLDSEDGHVQLSVADSGVGIASEDLPHIFDRFYRVDAGRSRESGGTGLGLSIVRWVVEAHGGTVFAASERGQGSTFTVRLPVGSG